MYFNTNKEYSFPRLCKMGNTKAANTMIVTLAAGYLAGGHCASVTKAIREAAEAVEIMLKTITGEDKRPDTEPDEGDGD